MKEERSIRQQAYRDRKPVISLSVSNLEMTVEEGRVYRDSFFMESENEIPIQGRIFSTNDKVETEVRELSGLRQEIPFYFKGKLATAGEEFMGDLVLITNGGEYNIPYRIYVIPRQIPSSKGPISDIDGFLRLYEQNRKEAVSIFFLPAFEEVLLKDAPEKRALYHSMMKSRSRSLITEEFLSAAGYKPVTRLAIEERNLILDVGKDRETIRLFLTANGYLEGTIQAQKGQVQLSASRFSSDDFKDGTFLLTIEKNKNYLMGSDVIHIRTIRDSFEIPVEWWGTLPAATREKEQQLRIRRQQAELMHNYLYFRTESIGFEDFYRDSEQTLDKLCLETDDKKWKLFKMHFAMMGDQREEAGALLEEIRKDKESLSELYRHYFLYLIAMYDRTPESIHAAVMAIRNFYETSAYKAEALWMLIYLDRTYVSNKRLQYDTIRQLFEAGSNSALLCFEACDILNEHPGYMDRLDSFEIRIFRWGVRYGYVSMALSYQFARLALKLKYFNRAVFHIAQKLYSVQPEPVFLQVICSLLIKGNRTGKEYHRYFREAVEAKLKLIGLNEFFIRSMDMKDYEIIPQRVLIYFTYSNSLDYVEKAYLYTNVCKNREAYDEVYGAYASKMLPFAQEQLLKGRINEHLAFLYTTFQDELLAKPENWKSFCDIAFYRRLTCKNRNIIGVYVSCPETGKETYYPLSGGTCSLETFNHRTVCYFVDGSEQRYVSDMDYTLDPFLSMEQFPAQWIRANLANRKLLLGLSGRIDRQVETDEVPILKKIVFNEDYETWMQIRALEELLVYYQNHQMKEDLSRWLAKLDYSNISPAFRKTLMDYYMEVGMIENAFFGIELYGCSIMGAAKRLKLAVFGITHNDGAYDETTLSLCYSAFIRKKYNEDTLKYLMRYFQGEMEDLLLIWERSRRFRLATADFEKRLLAQAMFTGNDSDGLFPVFSSLYAASPEEKIVHAYLEYASAREMEDELRMPDDMHRIIGEEMLAGRITDRSTGVHFLYYFAKKTEWHEKIRDAAVFLIRRFLEEEYYLPVYQAYSDFLTFPTGYEELTFLTFEGPKGAEVLFYYRIEGAGEAERAVCMHEELPGMYVCAMHFFREDHVNYRLEIDGRPARNPGKVTFETFASEGGQSRFFALDHLADADSTGEDLSRYLLLAFFTDRYVQTL